MLCFELFSEHSNVAQNRYVDRYNLRSRDKHFTVGEKCLVLQRDNTASKVFSRWRGPGEIVEVKSPYSYIVALDGARYHICMRTIFVNIMFVLTK